MGLLSWVKEKIQKIQTYFSKSATSHLPTIEEAINNKSIIGKNSFKTDNLSVDSETNQSKISTIVSAGIPSKAKAPKLTKEQQKLRKAFQNGEFYVNDTKATNTFRGGARSNSSDKQR